MLLPFPIRVPLLPAFIFTSLLVLVQLLEKTDPLYSALTFCFFMLSVLAFNIAGGFSRPSGAYIFAYSVFVVEVGTVTKACLGEPAQTNLQNPLLIMSAYVASIAGMLLAAFLSRRIATTADGVAGLLHVRSFSYYESAMGCLVIYVVISLLGYVVPGGAVAQILHSIQVVNPFLPLSILLGTVAAVRDSRGWRSTNVINIVSMGYAFYLGLLAFSKSGMFTSFTCWVIGIAWARFRLRFIHLVCIFGFVVFAEMVLVPLANMRDDVVTGSTEERTALVEHFLTHIPALRARAKAWEPPPDLDYRMYYYNQPEGILDRLSMMPNDSLLVEFSNQGHYFGYLAIRYYFENWMPHLIDPHKLEGIQVGGNAYTHELGGLSDNDVTTGISFSPTSEAFHIDGWRGILLLAPAVWFLLFVTTDATCGDIRRQPLGLLYVLVFAHVAPEGMLGGPIDAVRLLNVGFTLGVCFCGYLAPIVGMLLRGRRPSTGERRIAVATSRRFDTDVAAAS